MSNFRQLEVVGRGSETQLQVSENFSSLYVRYHSYKDTIYAVILLLLSNKDIYRLSVH